MTYRLLSLGCQMNTSDAERIAAVLEGAGFAEAPTEAQADLLGVVACSVRQKAIDRVYGRIHEWNRWKRERALLTFVTGCILPEDEAKFLRLFDLVFRIDDLAQLPEMIRTSGVVTPAAIEAALQPARSVTLNHTDQFWGITPRYGSTHAAYVPIQNGCDKFCTFCAVPYTRGREVSRPAADVLREVEELVARGCRSITLLGQNVNSYGRDRPGAELATSLGDTQDHEQRRNGNGSVRLAPWSGQPTFAGLLGEVGELCDAAPQQVWVYFTSPHPADMSPAVLEQIARHNSLAKQIHLPMQSADDKVLIRMNRNHRLDQYRAVVEQIRTILPTATLFTDIIVGFCGETEEQFERTRLAMEEFAFDMAYVAMYSPRPGAAAARWPDDVPLAEKKRRLQVLSAVLQRTALRHNRRWEGRTVEVLVEAVDRKPGFLLGRTEGRVPVRFGGGSDLIGTRVAVEVARARPLSLEGEVAAVAALAAS